MCLARIFNRAQPRWIRCAAWFLLCGAAIGPLSGCTAFQSVCSKKWMEDAFGAEADPPVDHVAVRWDHNLRTAQDPSNYAGGITGMIGRVYLLSEQTKQMCDAQGTIVIGMLDMTRTSSGRPPVPIGEWMFDADTLKKLKSKDLIGMGYTVFLPWNEYRPEIKQVKLLVKYVTHKGEEHLADHSLVTLQSGDQPAPTMRETVGPMLDRQIDMQMPTPAKRLQGTNQPLPFAPVPMDKFTQPTGPALAPQANGNRPNVPPADAPFQPIIMNPQARNPAPTPPIGADLPPSSSAETTIRYLPPR